MDVQGWESAVLAGARHMLARRAVRFIFTEVGFHSRDSDMQDFSEANRLLTEIGYEFCGLYDNFRWGPAKLFVGFANALYCLR
jgi:hypothetical protein